MTDAQFWSFVVMASIITFLLGSVIAHLSRILTELRKK